MELHDGTPMLNLLLASAGRRPYLARWFRDGLHANGVRGRIIIADVDRHAPAQGLADTFIVAPPVGTSTYRNWLNAVLLEQGVALAISVNDFELSEWSRLKGTDASFDPLICLDDETQAMVEDKFAMGLRLSAAGVAVPDTQLASRFSIGDGSSEFVVKGRFGSGSRGLGITTPDGLPAAIERATLEVTDRTGRHAVNDTSALDLVVVQPRVIGQEYGLDIVCDLHGELSTVLARRKIAMRGGETDKAVTVSSEPFLSVAQALGGILKHRGTLDVDVMVSNDGSVHVIDINPRFGGGYPFSHAAGAHVPAAYIAWLLNKTPRQTWLRSPTNIFSSKYIDIAVTSGADGSGLPEP